MAIAVGQQQPVKEIKKKQPVAQRAATQQPVNQDTNIHTTAKKEAGVKAAGTQLTKDASTNAAIGTVMKGVADIGMSESADYEGKNLIESAFDQIADAIAENNPKLAGAIKTIAGAVKNIFGLAVTQHATNEAKDNGVFGSTDHIDGGKTENATEYGAKASDNFMDYNNLMKKGYYNPNYDLQYAKSNPDQEKGGVNLESLLGYADQDLKSLPGYEEGKGVAVGSDETLKELDLDENGYVDKKENGALTLLQDWNDDKLDGKITSKQLEDGTVETGLKLPQAFGTGYLKSALEAINDCEKKNHNYIGG